MSLFIKNTMDKIFNNTEIAFSLKSDTELERASFLFKLIASQPLVKIGTAVTNFALKAHLPVEGLIRSTVFDHFCGGINENDCLRVVDNMFTKGVSSVLDYSVEGKEEFLHAGGENFHYLPCLNDEDRWIDVVKTLCEEKLNEFYLV